jgi:hypothetical protein
MNPFDFLSKIPVTKESDFQGNKNPPLLFPLPVGTDVASVSNGLKALNPSVQVTYSKGDGVLSVILPPDIRVGTDPVDLREVAFVLKCRKEVDDLKLPGTWEHCCGDHGGCCANKG